MLCLMIAGKENSALTYKTSKLQPDAILYLYLSFLLLKFINIHLRIKQVSQMGLK